jgi:hypothetical protein
MGRLNRMLVHDSCMSVTNGQGQNSTVRAADTCMKPNVFNNFPCSRSVNEEKQ